MTRLLPDTLPVAVILPVADTNPAVVTLPPVMLPVATTRPTVFKLPPVMLPVATTNPLVFRLLPDKLPSKVPEAAVIAPACMG